MDTTNTDNATLPKYTASFGLSLAITSVISALIVVAKEMSQTTVMVWMKKATGHHWATHSLIALVLFIGLGLSLARANGGQGIKMTAARLSMILLGGVVIGGLIIVGYYSILD